MESINLNSSSELLSILNYRGANHFLFEEIDYLGFPLSVSEEFQKRNTNLSISQLWILYKKYKIYVFRRIKISRVFIYGFWKSLWRTVSSRNCIELTNKLHILDVKTIALSDTIGVFPENISPLLL